MVPAGAVQAGAEAEISCFRPTALTKYAPVAALIAAPAYKGKLTEVSFNGPGDVWLQVAGKEPLQIRDGRKKQFTLAYYHDLCALLAPSMGIRFDSRMPILACRTPDGHRFQAVIGKNVGSGAAISIRIKRILAADWDMFEVSPADKEKIISAVENRRGIFISGGTNSGKTTFQNMLIRYIPKSDRIFTIEDTSEIDLSRHPNKVQFYVSRTHSANDVGWKDIIDSCVRLNPDVIIPGEVSIRNAFAILHAMDTGHDSIITTMHANSPMDALRGYRRRLAFGGVAITEVKDLYNFFADTVDVLIQVKHMRFGADRERRVVTDVVRVADLVARDRQSHEPPAAPAAPDVFRERPEDRRLLGPEDRTLAVAARAGLLDADVADVDVDSLKQAGMVFD